MALGVFVMLGLGTVLALITPTLQTLWLYGVHKSLGVTLLALVVLRLVWHRVSPPPAILSDGVPGLQMVAARVVHLGLYAVLIASPVSGWIGSDATGISTVIYGGVTLPSLVAASQVTEARAFTVHLVSALLLSALVMLHIAGALNRHFRYRDSTLRRMISGRQ